jgi:thymidine kinase
MSSCRIEIILGPMFSGKSTELMRRCSRKEVIGQSVCYINHEYDIRTGNFVQTHAQHKKDAIKLSNLLDIPDIIFNKSDIFGIDEAQFFPDLYNFVLKCEKFNKSIIMSGLDGDSNRKPFGQILECIPLCDSVVKLTAMDMIDKDGSEGIFSLRLSNNTDQVLVGAQDKFVAVSRKNFIENYKQK